MAGKPQLAVPTEVDKTVLAQRMARDGSAVLLAEGGDVEVAVDAALRLRLGAVTADPTANARLRAQLGGEA